LAEKYTEELEVSVKVSYNNSRGFHLSVPSVLNPLPVGFTQAILNKKTISCTSEDISALSTRANDTIENALSLTQELLQSTLCKVREKIEALFTLADSVVSHAK
jgi:DNA mismatch repair ATPase MutS